MDTPAPSAAERFPNGPQSFPAAGANSLATISRRWLARGVDAVLIGVPVLLATSVVLVLQAAGDPSAEPADAAGPTAQAVTWGALVAVAVLYETVTVTLWGQTLGKLLLGIRVARQVNGRCPLWWEAAVRIALPGVVATVPHPLAKAAAMALYAAAMFDPLRRGVADRAAGTVVVRTR
ncbi:MAG TPA: RDD family protein [Acidimicrobiales bacterium]|nr:RDD family protein [Acidimicrobiales bacterium]